MVLDVCRNSTERLMVLLFAQTGMRLGGICTIRPELVHDHYTEQWGNDAGKEVPATYVEVWER